ncbi:MAG: ribosome silencing factor [Armatimonadota bacterium]|nr:ribosome silencing factor [Armatimonadota bacterium]
MSPKAILTSEKKAKLALSAAEDKKAVNPVVLDVRDRTIMTDFFLIATGTSDVHVKAIADNIIEKFTDKGIKNKRVEGYEEAVWVLLDYGDVIIHIFAPREREYYNLESFWTGAESNSPVPLSPEERQGETYVPGTELRTGT